MKEHILLAYATKRGSTEEVAEVIAATLRESGHEVDLQAARDVKSIDQYAVVVLGAPLYSAKWHADAHQFLVTHHSALASRQVALFAMGGSPSLEVAALQNSRTQIDKELAAYPWLKPAAVGVFGGKYDPQQWSFLERLLYGTTYKDIRDWDTIRAWAKALPRHLELDGSTAD
jgi:menaquinone-dependent protoporphyrinogen oxidase